MFHKIFAYIFLFSLIIAFIGCYTVFFHPEELSEEESGYNHCADCHNEYSQGYYYDPYYDYYRDNWRYYYGIPWWWNGYVGGGNTNTSIDSSNTKNDNNDNIRRARNRTDVNDPIINQRTPPAPNTTDTDTTSKKSDNKEDSNKRKRTDNQEKEKEKKRARNRTD